MVVLKRPDKSEIDHCKYLERHRRRRTRTTIINHAKKCIVLIVSKVARKKNYRESECKIFLIFENGF